MRRCRSPWSSRSRPRSGRSPIRASRSWRRGSAGMSVVAIPHTAVRTAPRNLGDRILRGLLRLAALVLVLLLRTWVQPFLGATLGFLPLFQGPPYGVGMLAAGIILAIMVVPFITAVSREVLLAVPNTQREAALALGATRWETTRMAVLRYGRSGLVGAILLGLGRALGETMAVTMVIGNRPEIAISLFAPGYTMASVIANEFTEATSDLYLGALIEIGLLLFAVTVIVNALARLLVWSAGGAVKQVRE